MEQNIPNCRSLGVSASLQSLGGFGTNDTNLVKGVAILLLLFHHLFYENPEAGPAILGMHPLHLAALAARVCVCIFVLLSGYGLASSNRREALPMFWRRRLVKLLLNYWLIWLLFVPVCVLGFGRSFQSVYADHIPARVLLDLSGLQMVTGFHGYNATWWFVSLIIALYFLFPFLKAIIDACGVYGLLLTVPLLFVVETKTLTHRVSFDFVLLWIFPFTLGIFSAKRNLFVATSHFLAGSVPRRLTMLGVLALMIGLILAQRQFGPIVNGSRVDGPLSFLVVVGAFSTLSGKPILGRILEFLGAHSFNIFLFHTFIYGYFFPEFFLRSHAPLLSYVALLLACVIISAALEWCKSNMGYSRFEAWLSGEKPRSSSIHGT